MNNTCKVIWSHALQQMVVVSELISSTGKTQSSRQTESLPLAAFSVVATAIALAFSSPTLAQIIATNALPTGGAVVAGQASINSNAANMVIQQTSSRAVIDWNSFNVGSNAQVNFAQPSAQSATLNRITGPEASTILGRITAPGQIIISNGNGVFFGRDATVDVGSLVATTHSISNDNFMNSRMLFERQSATGSVVNQGELKARLEGYVALLAPEVRNEGVIIANKGTVALTAGETIELQLSTTQQLQGVRVEAGQWKALVDNRHVIEAEEGLVILSAQALREVQSGVVRHSGRINVNSLAHIGGRVMLLGEDISLETDSTITATGPQGGGTVLVGGDWQGSNNLPQATRVSMANNAIINASATDSGDGGKVVLWSDVHNVQSFTSAQGSISAKAGVNGGNGGNVETSGAQLNTDAIRVDASATKGGAGLWLIDPYDYTIDNTAATNIVNALNSGGSGTSVTVTTASSVTGYGGSANNTGTGNITVNSAISANTNNTTANLSLIADGNIDTNAAITVGGKLLLKAAGNITVGGNLTTNGNDITLWSNSDAGNQGGILVKNNTVLDSRTTSDRSNSTNTTGGGAITLAGGLDDGGVAAGTGNLISRLTANDGRPDGYAINYSTSGALQAGIILGSMSLQQGQNSNIQMLSGSGDIRLNGKSTNTYNTSYSPNGIFTYAGNKLDAGTDGNLTMLGVFAYDATSGGNRPQWGYGFDINGWRESLPAVGGGARPDNIFKTSNGNINIVGLASGASVNNIGIASQGQNLNGRNVFLATGTGTVTFDGMASGSGSSDLAIGSTEILSNSGRVSLIGSGNNAIVVSNWQSDGIFVGSKASTAISQSTGDVLIRANSVTTSSGSKLNINTAGKLTYEPFANSFASSLSWPTSVFTIANITGLTLGKASNTSNITLDTATTVAGPISLYGGNIAINAPLTATNDTITLKGTGTITDGTSGYLVADKLLLLGGSVTLDSASNTVNTIAAGGISSLSYLNSNALTIGSLGTTPTNGITATGTVNVQTLTGNLTVAQNISTTNTSSSALLLNAGKNESPGSATGGDIIISGSPTISVGSGGTAKLYTGSISGSTDLANLLGSASGLFRYHSDEAASNYTTALSTGLYAIYREQPSVTLSSSSGTYSMTYGDTLPTFSTSTTVNGDSSTVNIANRVDSTSGNIKAGSYSITSSPKNLGYAVTYSSGNGTFTVEKALLSVTIDAKNKTEGDRDPTLTYNVNSGTLFSGDTLTMSRVSGESVGNYAISAASSDYVLTANIANLNISPRSTTSNSTEQVATTAVSQSVAGKVPASFSFGGVAINPASRVSSPGIKVELVEMAQLNNAGLVTVTVPGDSSNQNTGFSFALPPALVSSFASSVGVQARLPGGQPLPSWLEFDSANGKFAVKAPPKDAFPLEIALEVGEKSVVVNVSERSGL